MAATADLKLTFGFTDETTRKLNIGPYATNAAALTGAKANIISFNSNDLNSVKGILLSDDGASCTGIVDAHILMTNETDINLND